MSQWGTSDASSNAVIWAATSVHLTPNTDNRDDLYGNTTADAFITGATIGQFAVDSGEMTAVRDAAVSRPPHQGWVLRTEGSGGRAGRVTYETLVALSGVSGDAEDTIFPDFNLRFTTQPVDASANSADNEQANFEVVAVATPDTTISYLWQYTTDAGNTETFATTVSVSGFDGQTSDTLTVDANTIADGTLVRCVISATGATSVTSDNAELTVTS